jgi:hypothetical protein
VDAGEEVILGLSSAKARAGHPHPSTPLRAGFLAKREKWGILASLGSGRGRPLYTKASRLSGGLGVGFVVSRLIGGGVLAVESCHQDLLLQVILVLAGERGGKRRISY